MQDARAHHCRAILEYENNELGRPLFCGHQTVIKIVNDRPVETSWCEVHRKLYTAQPHSSRTKSPFRSKPVKKSVKPIHNINISPERIQAAIAELSKGHGILRTSRKLKIGVRTMMRIKENMGVEARPVGAPQKAKATAATVDVDRTDTSKLASDWFVFPLQAVDF